MAALAAVLAGCNREQQESSIEPVPSSRDVSNPELGPSGVRPLSHGPGDKDSPTWGPDGERVAFVVDGYVADKTLSSRDLNRRTTRDLGAERVSWPASGEEVAILGRGEPSTHGPRRDHEIHPLYATSGGEGELSIERLSRDALALSSPSGDVPLAAAMESGAYESRISLLDADQGEAETYPQTLAGRVNEISVSPDGRRVLTTLQVPTDSGGERFGVNVFDLADGEDKRVVRLVEDMEIFGAPQQTSSGIYYVAGETEDEEEREEGDTRYSLYRVPPGSTTPERATGVGRDFIASSAKVSPDGGRLALLGRRDSGSATNLYILDLSDGSLNSATVNENMDIRTGADSLDWANDGRSLAIVARSDISGPRVYNGSADSLLADFYNVYEVPTDGLEEE